MATFSRPSTLCPAPTADSRPGLLLAWHLKPQTFLGVNFVSLLFLAGFSTTSWQVVACVPTGSGPAGSSAGNSAPCLPLTICVSLCVSDVCLILRYPMSLARNSHCGSICPFVKCRSLSTFFPLMMCLWGKACCKWLFPVRLNLLP